MKGSPCTQENHGKNILLGLFQSLSDLLRRSDALVVLRENQLGAPPQRIQMQVIQADGKQQNESGHQSNTENFYSERIPGGPGLAVLIIFHGLRLASLAQSRYEHQ